MIPALAPCVMFLLAVATIVVITALVGGRLDLGRVRCASCRAITAPATIVRGEPCPGCGADLSAPTALRPTRRGAGRRAWIALVFVIISWIGGVAAIAVTMTVRGRQGVFVTQRLAGTDDALTTSIVNDTGSASIVVGEFVARQERGALDHTLVRKGFRSAIAALPPGPTSTPQGGGLLIGATLLERDPNDVEVMDDLLAAFAPAPTVTIRPTGSASSVSISESMRRLHPHAKALRAGVILRAIEVDGTPVPYFRHENPKGAASGALLLQGGPAFVNVSNEHLRGAKEIVAVFDALLWSNFDGRRAESMSYRDVPFEDWPKPLRSTERRVKIPLPGAETSAPAP